MCNDNDKRIHKECDGGITKDIKQGRYLCAMWIKNHYSRKIVHNLRDKLRQLGANVHAYRGRSASAVTHLSRDSIYSIDNDNEAGGLHWFLQINSIMRWLLSGPSPIIFMRYPTRARARDNPWEPMPVHAFPHRSSLKCNERKRLSICKLRHSLFVIYKWRRQNNFVQLIDIKKYL